MKNFFYILFILIQISSFAQSNINKNIVNADSIYSEVEVMPTYPGGNDAVNKFLSANLKYPEIAAKSNIQGEVKVEFIVDKQGNITNPKITKSLGSGCDEEVLRVIGLMQKWSPGKKNGTTVFVKVPLTINFTLNNQTVAVPTIEEMPNFVGGDAAMFLHIDKQIKYPAAALKNKTHGRIYIITTIDEKGKVVKTLAFNKLGNGLEEEAERVIKQLPNFTPGIKQKQPIDYCIPVDFILP